MKYFILISVVAFGCFNCLIASNLPEVHFEWFNLNTNEALITDIIGLPAEASPGLLRPNKAEDSLETSESTLFDIIHVANRITIKWKENGTNGYHGDFEIPGTVVPGVMHKVDFKRDELGIPAKLTSGKIRFTYLGDDKWRIKYFP